MEILLIVLVVLAMAACCGIHLLNGLRRSKWHSKNRGESFTQEPEKKEEGQISL